MRAALEAALCTGWRRRGPLALMLLPLALVYLAITAARRFGYHIGWFKSGSVRVPLIVVGNVVAGGAGKTPVVIELLRHLRARGIAAGVVSRGYGRTTTSDARPDVREVLATSSAADAGDEPLLIARASGAPVFVGRDRLAAARALLEAHPGLRLIVSDDGLQHYALRRDAEICVFGESGAGNGWPLPAGPLRETGRRVTWVLEQRRASHDDDDDSRHRTDAAQAERGRFTLARRLADHALRADGTRIALASLVGRPVAAVAAVADPHAFFSMLRAEGLTLAECTALADHDDFSRYERAPNADWPLLCTEKDAVKLWRTRPDALAVPLRVEIDPAFFAAFDAWLDARLARAPLSSNDGHATS